MANREQLAIIKQARAGQREAQLALGRLYLRGSAGLPQSNSTALYWLDRAAQQGCDEAWLEIGSHIPYETVLQSEQGQDLWRWYQRAFEAGIMEAGVVFARLQLEKADLSAVEQEQARQALLVAAQAGLAQAQWLLARQAPDLLSAATPEAVSTPPGQHWIASAARGGVMEAQQALAERAWQNREWQNFLEWAQPLARALLQQGEHWLGLHSENGSPSLPQTPVFNHEQVNLLSRCAQALQQSGTRSGHEIQALWELAALHGDVQSQLELGLWFARMDGDGVRDAGNPGSANFKKAVRWLNMAGEMGNAQAWYALSRIYLKPEFSQRSVHDANAYLERAAELGHVKAQTECGAHAWRNRREREGNDIRALYWLQKAAVQGDLHARELLDKLAPPRPRALWAERAQAMLGREVANSQPFLAARIELAVIFGLSRAEALLLDVKQADQGHCLLINIRAQYGRSKRQLILLRDAAQRQALDRIARLFEDVDCGPNGPEGNYRQRLYRLKICLPHLTHEEDPAEQE